MNDITKIMVNVFGEPESIKRNEDEILKILKSIKVYDDPIW
jgi:hypothetical protein